MNGEQRTNIMTQFLNVANIETGVAALEISRPEALNALNSDVLKELSEAVRQLQERHDLSAIILRTAGDKAFVAGADIKEMINFTMQQGHEFARFGQSVFSALSNLPQVVIAQVQGFALGGGLELALAADFMIASQKAKFGLPEVGLGLIPGFGGTQRLVQRIGYARALEWMTSAERYSADVAFDMGLLNRVVVPEELNGVVESLARTIASQGPTAVRSAKQCARAARYAQGDFGFEIEAQFFAQRFGGHEAKEGLAAFVEKRKPQFRSSSASGQAVQR
jgi:enoyl-CoA hydratase